MDATKKMFLELFVENEQEKRERAKRVKNVEPCECWACNEVITEYAIVDGWLTCPHCGAN